MNEVRHIAPAIRKGAVDNVAHSMSSASDASSKPNFSFAMRAINSAHDLLVGVEKLFPRSVCQKMLFVRLR